MGVNSNKVAVVGAGMADVAGWYVPEERTSGQQTTSRHIT